MICINLLRDLFAYNVYTLYILWVEPDVSKAK